MGGNVKGRVYASCVRSSMTYGSETIPFLVDVGLKFERAEMQMIRWMCGISMKHKRNQVLVKTRPRLFQFLLHIKPSHQKMSTTRSQSLSSALTVISANIECLSVVKASILSDLCKEQNCLCLQETHRGERKVRPKIPGMTLVAERPHDKYGSAIFIRDELKVEYFCHCSQPCLSDYSRPTHSVYKPPSEQFVLPSLGHRSLPQIVIGDFNSHNTI